MNMTKYEQFALNHFLSFYPENVSFDDILKMVESESEEVGVWEPFECFPIEDVTCFIYDLVKQLKAVFYPIKEAACIIEKGAVKEMAEEELQRPVTDEELEGICKFVEDDFIYQVCEKVGDAITYLNTEK